MACKFVFKIIIIFNNYVTNFWVQEKKKRKCGSCLRFEKRKSFWMLFKREDNEVLMSSKTVRMRWKGYFERLFNEEFPRK